MTRLPETVPADCLTIRGQDFMLHRVPASLRIESKWLFLAAGVAIGLFVGHFSGSLQSAASGGTNPPDGDSIRVRGKERTVADRGDRLHNARLAQIREMAANEDYKVRDDFTESLGGADVPDLMAAFLADMALDGIDYKQRKMLEQAVHRWVADDIDAALTWAASLTQTKQRRYFQKMMLNEFAKTDPFRAADQALEIEAGDPDFDASLIVSSAIRELAKKGNELEIADLVRKTTKADTDGSFGSSMTFAEDFSHQTLLDSLAEMKREGLEFEFVPTGMLEAWAKRDPEAAHAWFLANGRVGFEEWEDVLNGVASSLGQQASGQWFLGKFTQADEEQRKMMVEAFDDTYDEPAARMVLADSLARQMPADLAAEFVDEVMRNHLGHLSDKQAEGLSLLDWYPGPEERSDVLMKHAGYRGVDKLLERFPESRLEPYGVTRESLEAAARRAKAKDSD